MIDVEAIRLIADNNDFSTQLVEYRRGYMIGRAMGAIEHDFEAAQIHGIGKGALAEFNIAPGSVTDAPGLAQTGRLHDLHGPIQCFFDCQLDLVRQLGALGGEELDAIVLERIMRGGNDNACLCTQCAGQVRYCGCWHRAG